MNVQPIYQRNRQQSGLLPGAGLALIVVLAVAGLTALSLYGTTAAMNYADPLQGDAFHSTFSLP